MELCLECDICGEGFAPDADGKIDLNIVDAHACYLPEETRPTYRIAPASEVF